MTKETALEILSRIKDRQSDYNVKSLALIGSIARDEAGPDSDIDILVEFNGPATFDLFMDLKFFLEETVNRRVDLVTTKALKPKIRSNIYRDAVYVT